MNDTKLGDEIAGSHVERDVYASAMDVCSGNIARHGRLAAIVFIALAVLVASVVVFASVYAKSEGGTRDSERFQRMMELKDSETALKQARDKHLKTSLRLAEEQDRTRDVEGQVAQLGDEKAWEAFFEKTKGSVSFLGLFVPSSKTPEEFKTTLTREITRQKERLKGLEREVASDAKALEATEARATSLRDQLRDYKPPAVISSELMAGLIALIVIIVSVFTSLYRFHLKEITKNEQFKIAFLRLGIANTLARDDVQRSGLAKTLTESAFSLPEEQPSLFRRPTKSSDAKSAARLESPLPGHPTSDLMTGVVNKLLEQVEIVLQPRQQGSVK